MPNVVFAVPFAMESSQRFVRAAASLPGVRLGVVSQEPAERLEPEVRNLLVGFQQVRDAMDVDQLADGVRALGRQLGGPDALLGILEPLQEPLAEVRERLRIRGMAKATARNFRDKARMKEVLREAGLPCAGHRLCGSVAAGMEAVQELGLPLVVKPPAGAGAKTTARADTAEQVREFLTAMKPRPEQPVLLEEFVQGREFSFDSVTLKGEHLFHSISAYQPTPLEVMQTPWIQWAVMLPRDISGPEYQPIRRAGPLALRALGMVTGMSHMEWFRRADGSIAISEVGARPPGAQFMTLMSYAHDTDLYRAWAELMIFERFQPPARVFATGAAYLRGQGKGKVVAVHGIDEARAAVAADIVEVKLPKAGQAAASSYEGEGYVIVRHRETRVVEDALKKIVTMLRVELSEVNVVFLSPGFPAEMPLFTRGLAQVGARVLGVGDTPAGALPEEARRHLHDYLQVKSMLDEGAVVDEVRRWQRGKEIDRVESLWEPGMILAARLREAFSVPGMTVEQTVPFRDKEVMKQRLDAAGLRVPRHGRARTAAEARLHMERIGFPLIVKPIAGAGSKDTWRCDDQEEFEQALVKTRHVQEISVEEYIDGEELTFDTVCADGKVLFHNVAWYRPKPMLMVQMPWISPQNICLRDADAEFPRPGKQLGLKVLQVLGFRTGFTHMEWYRTAAGEAVFGEIGARAPGARLVHAMNYSCDIDLFTGWAEAVVRGTLSQDVKKKYNAGMVFKRAQGEGRVLRYEGLQSLLGRYGPHVANVELTPIGQPKRDPDQVLVGDGWVVVRHPDLQFTLEMTEAFANELRLIAG